MSKDLLHEKREFANVRELVEWAAEEYGEKYAYSYRTSQRDAEVTRISYNRLRDDVRGLTSRLISMGVFGKKVCVIGKFSYPWVLAYYSVLCTGGVLVPLDRDWSAEELGETAKRAEAEFLFVDADIKDKGAAIAKGLALASEPLLIDGDGEDSLAVLAEAGCAEFRADSAPYFNTEIDASGLSLLVFTSGTTGKGKGVMLSQRAVLSDLSSIIPYIAFREKTVGVLPPHHTFGSSVMIIGHTMIGCEVYISAGLRYVQKELKEEKPGHLILVPLYLETFYRKIWANIKDQGKERLVRTMIRVSNLLRKVGIDLRRKFFGAIRAAFGGEVSMIISGGAPINPDILDFFDAVGISTLNGYGITECAPIIAVNRSKNVVKGSVGNVVDIDTVIIDEPNEDGEGEILVKGPNVMLGYYKDEAATAEAITPDGFFRTGDYGKLDKNNVLYITGRKKNLIILSNGKNVYPEEIENELVATPGVQDIVVYEGESRRGMEHNAIVAEIYPDKEYIEKNKITDVRAYLEPYIDEYNKSATPYKKIAVLKIRNEDFPKNTLRKIMRFNIDMTID